MRYVPVGYLPKVNFTSRWINPLNTDNYTTMLVQKSSDKKTLSKDDFEKKHNGNLVNSMYVPSSEDYESNLEQVRNYCYYLQLLVNHYLSDNEIAQILEKFEVEHGTRKSWYVWLNAEMMKCTKLSPKFPAMIRCLTRILLSPHLQFSKNECLRDRFIKTVRVNMMDKENIIKE